MDLVWKDYSPKTMSYVEEWLDERAVSTTGIDEGFRDFYEYWANEDGMIVGENYWCKVAFENDIPIAVVALSEYEGKIMIMEIVVAPKMRGKGRGTKLLKELLGNEEIIGHAIQKSEAVIYPNNIASQKAFENAGFKYHHTNEDGDAMYYVYER